MTIRARRLDDSNRGDQGIDRPMIGNIFMLATRTPGCESESCRSIAASAILSLVALVGSAAGSEGRPIELFGGKDLAGWVNVDGGPGTWSVDGGVLVVSGRPSGFLRTEQMYENYVLELEWRILDPGGTSGLLVHADALPQVGAPYPRAVEAQIHDGDHGSISGIQGATVEPLTNPGNDERAGRARPVESRCNPIGQWNRYVVTSQDGTLDLEVNGKRVTQARGCSQRMGFIALQSETGRVQFRNIRLAPRPGSNPPADRIARDDEGLRSLCDGVSFAGWQYRDGHAGRWSVRDGVIQCASKGKPRPRQDRDLWSEKAYRDFVLCVDWRLPQKPERRALPVFTADGLFARDEKGKTLLREIPDAGDSGVFVRGSSRSQVNIWSQPMGSGDINDYHKDQTLPAEIRKACMPSTRADAPFGQWNRFVITMQGDRITVVLNGETVIDRALLPGVSAEGPIALQDHNDLIEFRNVFIRELR
jgi:hypothetical protein